MISSPSFILRHPTPEEAKYVISINAESWAGDLTLPQYLDREHHLHTSILTRDGGISFWVLVNPSDNPPVILASAESIRKDVFVAHPPVNGEERWVEEAIAHGIGSVFTPVEQRGKGYAKVMLRMLGERLKTHQASEDKKCGLSVLYSDIGKEFYAKLGWHPHPSTQLEISVPASPAVPKTTSLPASALPPLCTRDIVALKKSLSHLSSSQKTKIAFPPDYPTFNWHHTREEFIRATVHPTLPPPTSKGAISASGKTWAVWTRDFNSRDPKLVILRIVKNHHHHNPQQDGTEQTVAEEMQEIIKASLAEAKRYNLKKVVIWTPDDTVMTAANIVAAEGMVGVNIVERGVDSICSLMMYDGGISGSEEEVEWVASEKYAWC